MYINIPFNYTNPPPPAPSPLLMKDFDIFLAIRKTLFFPQSPSKSLPYESYKIIASEMFAGFSICYLSRRSGLQSCNCQKFHIFLLLVNGGWGGAGLYIKWNVSIELKSPRESHDGQFCNFSSHPLDIKFSDFCFLWTIVVCVISGWGYKEILLQLFFQIFLNTSL